MVAGLSARHPGGDEDSQSLLVHLRLVEAELYLAQYISRECGRGRALDDVLADPYVRNRSTPEQRARVLERPEVVEAVGESAVAEMKQALSGAGGRL